LQGRTSPALLAKAEGKGQKAEGWNELPLANHSLVLQHAIHVIQMQ
jgi:hypothetical protein